MAEGENDAVLAAANVGIAKAKMPRVANVVVNIFFFIDYFRRRLISSNWPLT